MEPVIEENKEDLSAKNDRMNASNIEYVLTSDQKIMSGRRNDNRQKGLNDSYLIENKHVRRTSTNYDLIKSFVTEDSILNTESARKSSPRKTDSPAVRKRLSTKDNTLNKLSLTEEDFGFEVRLPTRISYDDNLCTTSGKERRVTSENKENNAVVNTRQSCDALNNDSISPVSHSVLEATKKKMNRLQHLGGRWRRAQKYYESFIKNRCVKFVLLPILALSVVALLIIIVK